MAKTLNIPTPVETRLRAVQTSSKVTRLATFDALIDLFPERTAEFNAAKAAVTSETFDDFCDEHILRPIPERMKALIRREEAELSRALQQKKIKDRELQNL